MPQLLRERLRALREEQGLSRDQLAGLTVSHGKLVGTRVIQSYEIEPGRLPSADIIETLAAALNVKPEELAFHEYPIALARREGTSEHAKARIANSVSARARSGGRQPKAPHKTAAQSRQKGAGK